MASDLPLVSVGIPTYNRPEGLRRTLNCITAQTYPNLEIIVSDNFSENIEVAQVIEEFCEIDKRIISIRQIENIGPIDNFKFLLNKAIGKYFMWAADDDYFESINLIEELVKNIKGCIMAFPDFKIYRDESLLMDQALSKIYIKAQSNVDYLFSWLRNGSGQPIYGMYNLQKISISNLKIDSFNYDLEYFNEGIILHELFIFGNICFVPNVYIVYNSKSNPLDSLVLLTNFNRYTYKCINLYISCKLSLKIKIKALIVLYNSHSKYTFSLLQDHLKESNENFYKFLFINPKLALIALGYTFYNLVIHKLNLLKYLYKKHIIDKS
jgi:glycosyltransferase involved in cell wall biosynthesis